jgi:hypothetical protein
MDEFDGVGRHSPLLLYVGITLNLDEWHCGVQ